MNKFVAMLWDAIRRWPIVGVLIGFVVLLVGKYVFPMIPDVSFTFSTIPVGDTAIPPFGESVLNFFKFGAASWITVVVSAAIMVILGRFMYNFLPKGKSDFSKLMLVLLYGALLGWLLFSWAGGLPMWTMLVAFVIYYAIIAAVAGVALKVFKMPLPQ